MHADLMVGKSGSWILCWTVSFSCAWLLVTMWTAGPGTIGVVPAPMRLSSGMELLEWLLIHAADGCSPTLMESLWMVGRRTSFQALITVSTWSLHRPVRDPYVVMRSGVVSYWHGLPKDRSMVFPIGKIIDWEAISPSMAGAGTGGCCTGPGKYLDGTGRCLGIPWKAVSFAKNIWCIIHHVWQT